MAHFNYKPKKEVWKPSLSVEERVDLIYAEIIQSVFEDFYSGNGGPGDILIDFGITREEYEQLICQDPRGGIDGFQERVLDVLEASIKDLSIFNGQPTSDKTVITNIFDVIEFEDGEYEYPYVFKIGLKRNNDE